MRKGRKKWRKRGEKEEKKRRKGGEREDSSRAVRTGFGGGGNYDVGKNLSVCHFDGF